MKLEIKSIIIGVLIGAILVLALGATTLQEHIAALRLIKDDKGHALIIDLQTGKAVRIKYSTVVPERDTVSLSENWNGRIETD